MSQSSIEAIFYFLWHMAETATHRTKTELALQILRDRIRTGALEPGRRLRLNLLTAELGMSPTPIREALRLLQADGLVTYRPHQGIVVAELSEPQTAEVIRLRCLLEGSAVELAVASLTPAELRELERLHQRFLGAIEDGRGRDIVAGNEAWHHALYEASGLAALDRVHPPALGRLPVAHDVGAARPCRAVRPRARGDHGGARGRVTRRAQPSGCDLT